MAEMTKDVFGGMFDSTEVVENVGGFPRGNKAVDASFFAKMISCFYRDGVLGEDSLAVSAGDGMNVQIGAGIAWIRGYMAWNKKPEAFPVAAGKTYAVLLRLNTARGEFSFIVTDQPQSAIMDGENMRDLVLAEVTVPADAVEVTAGMITDTRTNRDKCGIVTSTIDALGICALAENANMLGGVGADAYLKKTGGVMTGNLRASADATGASVVRNISYGSTLPSTLADGELFVLVGN